MNYLAGISEQRMHESIIEGLECLRKRDAARNSFAYRDIVGQVARLLIAEKAQEATEAWVAQQVGYQQDQHGTGLEYDNNRKLLGAIWQLIATGVVFPRIINRLPDGHPLPIDRVTVTKKGERLLSNGAQHPLHPRFISRFVHNAPTATPMVVAHLEDAVECLRAALPRPTLMMLGVANEETIRTVHDALVHLELCEIPRRPLPVRTLLTQLSAAWNSGKNEKKTKDEIHRIQLAVSTAECIRYERNKAAHPGSHITDVCHVERLLMLLGHHLPVLWEQLVAPAVQEGFQLKSTAGDVLADAPDRGH